ncbi:MAG: hypothetical protein ACM3OF_15590 [Gemmatimonas sp.]
MQVRVLPGPPTNSVAYPVLFGRNGGTAPETAPDTCAFRSPRSRIAIFSTASIAEATRILLFMTATILIFNFYPVTAVMVVLLALLNDLPIMMIAYDNAPIALKPVRWDMTRVLTIASVLGTFAYSAASASSGSRAITWGSRRQWCNRLCS